MISVLTTLALSLVYPATPVSQLAPVSPVSVSFHQDGDNLSADFEVKSKKINAKSRLAVGEYPYQFDVVELFISVDGASTHLPYYEVEVGPLNQDFEVKIIDLKHHVDGFKMNFRHSAESTADGWKAEMIIPLKELGWKGDQTKIIGNAFAVLGTKPDRQFWSLFLPPQTKPNFHRPEFFKPLLNSRRP